MFGWDVGFVWPLLEGVVVSPVARARDSVRPIMGNPHEASSSATTSGDSTPVQNPPTPQNTATPPPYESVATEEQAQTSANVREPRSSSSGNRRSRPPNRNARSGNGNAQRLRPPKWPHKASTVFACLSCVLGVATIDRFALLVYIFKGPFIVQFLLLTCLFGLPMLYMQMALGQYLGSGMLDMWYISPAFKGLGFAMLYLYIFLGVTNAVPLSWLFIYFKDSFITLKDSYKWGKCHFGFARTGCVRALNSSSSDFYGFSVPSYFNARLLGRKPGEYQLGELKFEVAFNLCLVWIIVFVCLSRGPKTFGKVVYVFIMLPIALLLMVTMRMGQQYGEGILEIFTSPWSALLDPSVWWLAAREVFIAWGLLGTVAMHICSHNKTSANVTKNLITVAVIATSVLIMGAFLFVSCANALNKRYLSFDWSSYEEETTVKMLQPTTPYSGRYNRNVSVTSLLSGVSIIDKGTFMYKSGYQVLRLATEAFPAALAVEGVRSISSFWSICFYTSMILFGFGQQVVMWYCVVESIVAINLKVFKAWHTTLAFISCNLAFLLGLPVTSNMGIYIVYYLDFCLSSLWWIVMMYFIMLFAILFIRGRPYGTDQLVNIITRDPVRRSKILPFFTVMWNIVLPVSFLLLTISFLRTSSIDPSSSMGELMDNYRYWPQWAKSLNLCVQMFPLTLILFVCAYQAYKVFSKRSDKPFVERLKLLCCPIVPLPPVSSRHTLTSTSSISQGSTNSAFLEDPPPKYTPPPSYSTATSRMIAKQLEKQRQKQQHDTCTLDFESLDVTRLGNTLSSVERMQSQNQMTSEVQA